MDGTEDTQPTVEPGATAEESPEAQEPVDVDESMDTVNDTDADEAPVPTRACAAGQTLLSIASQIPLCIQHSYI